MRFTHKIDPITQSERDIDITLVMSSRSLLNLLKITTQYYQ